jgi:hypothetical protein
MGKKEMMRVHTEFGKSGRGSLEEEGVERRAEGDGEGNGEKGERGLLRKARELEEGGGGLEEDGEGVSEEEREGGRDSPRIAEGRVRDADVAVGETENICFSALCLKRRFVELPLS